MSEAARAPARRGGVWLTLFAGVAFVILMSLGVWQLQRRAWKEDLLARIAAAERAPPQRLQSLLAGRVSASELEFGRAFAYCEGLDRAPFVELYGLVDGRAGWRLISACRLRESAYDAVLVDRGFAPDTVSARPAIGPSPTAVRVVGVLRAGVRGDGGPPPTDGRFFSRDIAGMGRVLGVQAPAPVMLGADAPIPDGAGLAAAPLPGQISNRHLEYALTWFGLAAALLAFYVAMMVRRRTA